MKIVVLLNNKWRIIIIIFGALTLLLLLFVLFTVFFLFTSKDRTAIFSKPIVYQHNGLEREYRKVSPKNSVEKIVIGLHGFSDTSRRFAYYTGLHNVVDENTLVLYPQASKPTQEGIRKGWNAGFCCGSGAVGQIDDAGFIVSLVESIKQEYDAQDAKVYATGFSNGAFMAQRLAIDYPNVFSAVASSSGTIGTTDKQLEPETPVPILLLHGEKDSVVPFNGGVGSTDPNFNWLSHQQTLEAWQVVNGSDAETKSITYPDDGHKWHGWRILNVWQRQPEASREIVSFFESN